MANTTEVGGRFVSITLDGSTDWDITADMPGSLSDGLCVKSISVYAADSAIIICRDAKDANQTSPKMFHFVADAGQLNAQYRFGGAICWPSFDAGDCGAGVVTIELG